MKVKRLLTLILTLCMILSCLPANVYALEGCDGVLDAGEIELESYIEWNSFKSKIDNVSRDVLEEIRAAEGRMIPEIYPVGDNKVVVKTDVGFYSFIRQEDGSYVDKGLKVRFAHFGNYKDGTLSWVTGSELKSGVSGNYNKFGDCCCLVTGVVDYGKYGDHFYVLCSANNGYNYSQTHSNELDDKNSHMSSDAILVGYILYVVNADTDTGLATAWHSYFESSGYSSKSYSPYFGGDSMYGVFLRESYSSDAYKHELTVQEYDLTKGEIHTSLAQSIALSYTANSNSATTLSGRFSDSYNNAVKIPRDDAYPYGDMKYGVGDDNDDSAAYRYITSKYLATDKGERSYKAPAGIIAPSDHGNIIRYYADRDNSRNAVINGFGQVMPITATQLSQNQQQVGATIVAKHARDYGIPFYGKLTINRWWTGDYQLTLNSSRTTDTDRNGNVYHDGIQVLHKNYTPKLGQDGKYILDTETTHTIGGGIDKNTSRLTFSNLSLGSDAKIEIYGITADGSEAPLLETITSSKNSLGTYTTPIFNYGAVTVKFTAGSSASGRGQGYTISKLEFGDCGIDDTAIVYEPAPKVSIPHIGYSNLIEAEIPTSGSTARTATANINGTTVPNRRSSTLIKENVRLAQGSTVKYTNLNSSYSSYSPYDNNTYLQVKNRETGTMYSLSCSSSSPFQTTFSGPTGDYDLYGYRNSISTYYEFKVDISGMERTYISNTTNNTYTIKNYVTNEELAQRFTRTYDKTYTYSTLSAAGINTGYYTKLGTFQLDQYDGIRFKVNSTTGNFYSNVTLYYVPEGGTNYSSMSYTNLYEGNSVSALRDRLYQFTGASGSYDLYIYHSSYSNTSYQMQSSDTVELDVYKCRLEEKVDVYGRDFTTSSKYLFNTTNESGKIVKYTLLGGGNSYNRLYVNGSYNYTNSTGSYTIYNSNGYRTYAYLTNTSYALSADTKYCEVELYETPYSFVQYSVRKVPAKHTLSVPYKSGYTGHNAKVTVTLKPNTSTYYSYTIKIGDKEQSSSASSQYTYTYTTHDFTDVVEVSAGMYNSSYSYSFPIDVEVKVEYRYYDNAGTQVKRYTTASQQTYTYNIRDLENHFTRLNMSAFNVPNEMVLSLNGTQITGKGTTSWSNNQNNVVTLTIPGDATYGRYLKKEMSDVIDYTLQSKSLADATTISTYNSANLGKCEIKSTTTTTNNGSRTYYSWSSTPATITGVSNSYIQIESGLSGAYKNLGNSSSATGLRNVGSVSPNNNRTHLRSGVVMDWEPTSSGTVTISQNSPYTSSYNNASDIESPTGVIVTNYKVIKATGIPDSTIKTYTYDDTNIATLGNKIVGKNTFKDTFNSIKYITNIPTTFRNSYSSANTWQTMGSLQVVNSDGTTSAIGTLKGDGSVDHIEADLSYTSRTGSNTANMKIVPGEGYGKQVISYVSSNDYSYAVNLEETYMTSGTFYGRFMLGNKVKMPDAKPKVVTEDLNYSTGRNESNPDFGLSSFRISDWAGNLAFEDGRYGVGRYSLEAQTSSSNKYKLSRIDVYRKGADGKVSNLAVIPVTATDTWFDKYSGLDDRIDDTKPPIYHIGNDLMYVGGGDIESVTASTYGNSLAWLRTGHWHLKGSADEIEGITQGGINNPVKTMETDDADTEIVVSELDMNAKSWQMGHNIKDGKVTDQKLSDDVKKELREINLGTVTFIKGDGEQYRYVPVGTYGVDASTLDGVRLKYGTRYVDLYEADDNQIEVEAVVAMAGNKNIGGSTAGSLPLGENVFTGTVTVDGVSVPVVLQVNVINRPTTSGKTTITLTD